MSGQKTREGASQGRGRIDKVYKASTVEIEWLF
jgi:hypothetical protein